MKNGTPRCATVQSWRVDCECGWSSRSYDGEEGRAEAQRERDWHLQDAHDPRKERGAGTPRLRKEMEQHAQCAGKVLHVEVYEPAKGGGWVAVFDTEYAALKVHYKYLGSHGLRLGKSPTYGGWYVSTTTNV